MTDAESIPKPQYSIKKVAIIVGLVGGIISAALGGWQIMLNIQDGRTIQKKIMMHLDAGDRFLAQSEIEQALTEYDKAIKYEETNIPVQRRIIFARSEKVLMRVFTRGLADIALNRGVDSGFGEDSGINPALTQIYQLQALHPKLKTDVNLMLTEASLLKAAGGGRAHHALKVLGDAFELQPKNSKILAELGLLRNVMADEREDRITAIDLIRQAIKLDPDDARYHFYLASSLARQYRCTYLKKGFTVKGEDKGCADAIRGYHAATDLAVNDDIWSRHIRHSAPKKSMDIFHRYGLKEKNILTDKLAMPYSERKLAIEYSLKRNGSSGHNGPMDIPLFWLALLNHVTNDLDGTNLKLKEIVDKHGGKRMQKWLELYISILEKNEHTSNSIEKLRELARKVQQPS